MRPLSLLAIALVSALVVSAGTAQDHADSGAAAAEAPTTETAVAEGAVHTTRATPHTKAARATRPRRRSREHARPPAPPDPGDGTSLSIGRHNRGRLLHGHEIASTPSLRLKSASSDARYGTDELVALIERASARVMERSPGARLMVGNLSHVHGGRFRPHRSHQSGRDVDLGFYVTGADGAPMDLDRFYDFRRDLSVRGHEEMHFDLPRNWLLVHALITDDVPVQWIFVCRYLRTALLEEGARQGASAEVLAHADAILSQPSHGGSHNDQFHVRIYCPIGDRPRCLDDPPMHPWMVQPTVEVLLGERD